MNILQFRASKYLFNILYKYEYKFNCQPQKISMKINDKYKIKFVNLWNWDMKIDNENVN